MKSLRTTTAIFILFISALFVTAQSTIADSSTIDKQQAWIQSVLDEQGKSIKSNDYLFYCTGHHGIIWSLVVSDSSGIYLYNGTTRNHIKYVDQGLPDSLSFIKDNIKTITWGFDSLANVAQLLTPLKNEVYNPVYNQLYVIKDGNMAFSYNDAKDCYTVPDSTKFNYNLSRLVYLMFWLAAPSSRPYMPQPRDTLLTE